MPRREPTDVSSDCDFVITRLLNAPVPLVFKVWTDPRHLSQWWGPKPFTTPLCEIDLRVGGAYRIVMRSPEGIDYPLKGFYREIVEPERLVMTMDLSDHPEEWYDQVLPNRPRGVKPALEALQTVTFEAIAGRTKLTIRTRFDSVAIRNAMVKLGMNEGWSQSLDRLEEHLVATAV